MIDVLKELTAHGRFLRHERDWNLCPVPLDHLCLLLEFEVSDDVLVPESLRGLELFFEHLNEVLVVGSRRQIEDFEGVFFSVSCVSQLHFGAESLAQLLGELVLAYLTSDWHSDRVGNTESPALICHSCINHNYLMSFVLIIYLIDQLPLEK